MAVPTIITTKLAELEQLCEKYPTKIPIEGWLKKNAHNRAFYIPTLTFYLWVTQSAGFREGVRV